MTTSAVPAPQTRFVPAPIDATSWDQIRPLAASLLARPVTTVRELETWLEDRGELEAAISEAQADLYISMTCDTENQAVQKAYAAFIETIPPRYKPLAFTLDRRQVELTEKLGLPAGPGERYEVLARDARTEVELFREENVPIQTELALLSQEYDQVAGAMTVQFEGREQTLPQMVRYQELTDRAVREAAWRAVAARRFKDRDTIESIYDRMLVKRNAVAANAGFSGFAAYAFKEKHRFDYTERHCRDYHESCETVLVPMIRRLHEQRRRSLGLSSLRPWDLAVDVKGRAPLKPFENGAQLQSKATAAFKRLDPRLAGMLASLGDGSAARGSAGGASLDLDTRKGKAPGGYQYNRDRSRRPFIFMNAAGLSHDVETMFHEAGHAFHSLLAAGEPLLAYRSAPMEFCEVASMSMELLTMPYLGEFYPGSEDLARARRHQLERTVVILPWIAQIDAFQFWVYGNPGHSREQRRAAWLELDGRLGGGLDWTGLEETRGVLWHRQLHLFSHPFYYIEYAIAQLGALQLWLQSKERGEKAAVESYIRAMSLGGSRPLPGLFKAAGLTFDFGKDTVKRLVDRVEAELEALPL